MKNFYDHGYNDIWVVIATEWCHYLFYWQLYFLALGTVLPKSFTRAFSSNSCLNVCEVSLQASSSLGDVVKSRCARGTQAGRERRACNGHSFIFLSYLCGTLCQPKPTISWTKSVPKFCTFLPTECSSWLFDTTMAPHLAPPWSMLSSQGQKWSSQTSTLFYGEVGGGGGFVVTSAFQSFILKLDIAMSIFLRITLLSKIVAWSSDFLPTVAWLGLYLHKFWSR